MTEPVSVGSTFATTAPDDAARDRLWNEIRHWRACCAMLAGCVILGVAQAVSWAAIAPGEQFKVFKDGTFLPLPTESTHQYTSVALFTLIALVVGVSVAIAGWSWRSLRGSVMLLAVGAANGLGALTAYLLGRVLTSGVDPSSVGPSAVESVVRAAPALGGVIVIVVQPAVAVALYTFLVAWNGLPDLGRGEPRFRGTRSLRRP
jgi:hypothetical protein